MMRKELILTIDDDGKVIGLPEGHIAVMRGAFKANDSAEQFILHMPISGNPFKDLHLNMGRKERLADVAVLKNVHCFTNGSITIKFDKAPFFIPAENDTEHKPTCLEKEIIIFENKLRVFL